MQLTQLINESVLKAVCIKAPSPRQAQQLYNIADFGKLLPEFLQKFEVNTPLRIAHFLAQAAHESDSFSTLEEYASGRAYEGRKDLGNVMKGDGERFKGRSPFQLTGRANYRGFTIWLRKKCDDCPNFEKEPKKVAEFPWAAWATFYFWSTRNLNLLADLDDLRAVTRKINGGTNGLNSRAAFLSRAKNAVMIVKRQILSKEQDFNVLARGMRSQNSEDDVIDVQTALVGKGFALGIDGIFGAGTEAAVKAFQKQNGLNISGMVDKPTANRLFAVH